MTAVYDEKAYEKWNKIPDAAIDERVGARTRGSILQEAGKISGQPGYSVKHPPLFTLPTDLHEPIINNLAQDLLHMRMRISENLTTKAILKSSEFTGQKLAPGFEAIARKTGVPFRIYEHNVHGQTKVAFSSLTGRNWTVFLSKIANEIRQSSEVLSPEDREKFASLFDIFRATLNFAGKCRREDATEVAKKAREWMLLYVGMGYKPTPYMHDFHLHLAKSVELHGAQDRFSGEGVELANNSLKQTHHRRTDRRNPRLTLQTQLRIELQIRNAEIVRLAENERRKRKAGPLHPWQGIGVKQRQQEKRLREDKEREEVTQSQQSSYDLLSIEELKDMIHQRSGEKTRKRSRESLKAILINLDEMDSSHNLKESESFIHIVGKRGQLLSFKSFFKTDLFSFFLNGYN